ncbi:DUF1592 domain-containing protein [Allorhodopirellula solitaria]|uniref:Planctomycete cytochrome C n=1 Tax=Allorhodopirellula solitaria TaxID=2527987 RepID=A0A5C5YAZ8_9BACT|nr:DUF1592 domain-containing protein [Allorhodopirellula solitaria]TWT72886.1 hypothetical protein CA85_13470 [Allorhodopirellula solitaria]
MLAIRLTLPLLLVLVAGRSVQAESLQSTFDETVRPFLLSNCLECHNEDVTEGGLDLDSDSDVPAVVKNFRRWASVLDRLEAGEMPPEDADHQPTESERAAVIAWIEQVKVAEAKRTQGDPGVVLPHRLSSNEYNYTIRDLIGEDIQPAASFPVDPANEAGFDNSGESLAMSPALLKKYLAAARMVSEHLALTPSGFEFAPHPVMTFTDRDKFCVNRIIDFYRRQRTDYADYFTVLWRYQHRESLGRAGATLAQLASEEGISERYCQTLWEVLSDDTEHTDDRETVGPIAALRILLSELPDAATPQNRAAAEAGCQRMAAFVAGLRESLVPHVPNLTSPQMNNGSQSLVLWKNRQFVANRRRYVEDDLPQDDFGLEAGSRAAQFMEVTENTDTAAYRESLTEFCDIFPDQFYVSERARVYLDQKKEKKLKGRYLSAGFHSQMGYFRDDAPLYDLMLDKAAREELDRLWLELDFVTSAPMRQYSGFIWFDRTDSRFMRDRVFDRYRAEDKDCTSAEKVAGLADAYCEKAERVGASDQALRAIRFYFQDMSKTFRRLEKITIESQPRHFDALVDFAARAYRRPLTDAEKDSIRSFYESMRQDEGLSHEEAIRDGVVAVLMSPHFCYRVDVAASLNDVSTSTTNATSTSPAIQPLSDYSLASRLSYFLWSSMPDEELLQLAADNRLHEPAVMVAQSRRLLADERADGFVTEFAGNWLDFRRFTEHNGVDRERFPVFTDELRQAMADEPIRFCRDLIERDGSVLDFLYADHTFVNPVLGQHYGVESDRLGDTNDQWVRWDHAAQHGRGGLLPMAVFLTHNSSGLRTSPVQRGNWLIKRMLGEKVPAPPATVPDLPSDESKLGDFTLRETLARHRQDVACAGCHNRIDSMGLVFEGYGPIGELRDADLGGRAIDDSAVFPDDSEGHGLAGVLDYIRSSRQDDFVDNLCRKLLAFGLGRTLQLSDESVISDMKQNLADNDYRFSSMIDVIVASPAFLNKRVHIPLQETVAIP